jgi:DNA-directed RNA polymerase specialized sigma24 family protein
MAFRDSGEPMEPNREQGLLAAARTGYFPAFLELARSHQRLVYGVAYALTGNSEEAESLAADVFAKAWLRIGELEEKQRFLPWIFSVMRDLPVPASPGATPDGAVLGTFTKLPRDERIALALRVVARASYDEIAACLEVSPVIAAFRVSQARGRLLPDWGIAMGEDA